MLYYIVWFCFGFVIDRVKNKIIAITTHHAVKTIKWKHHWHYQHDTYFRAMVDLAEWIVL